MNKKAMVIAIGAYFIWGVLPIYWKQLQHVSSMEVLAHRIFWSLIFLLVIMLFNRRYYLFLDEMKKTFSCWSSVKNLILTAVLLNINWLTYIWAVNHDFILQTSLGYYINPIISVVLGLLILHERLSVLQWLSFFFVVMGVSFLIVQAGVFPWVSLILAFSFAFYGLIKKRSQLPAISSLALEAFVSSVPSVLYVLFLVIQGKSVFFDAFGADQLYLIGAGAATAIPLILFNISAKRLPLFMIGFFQYLAPTMTLLVAIFIYGEVFSKAHAGAFIMVWIGLLFFSISIFQQHRVYKKLKNKDLEQTVINRGPS